MNLFAYTGSISVAAANGGAESVVSVDTSNTYLKWAEENFALNGLRGRQHQFIKADVLTYLNQCQNQFDLIIADPPTYSNSHSRDRDWDLQKDHAMLIEACVKLLSDGGKLYFSNNFKKFVLDTDIKDKYQVKDITEKSLDPDFSGSKIHQCFEIVAN